MAYYADSYGFSSLNEAAKLIPKDRLMTIDEFEEDYRLLTPNSLKELRERLQNGFEEWKRRVTSDDPE